MMTPSADALQRGFLPPAIDDPALETSVVAYLKDRFEASRSFDRPFKAAAMDDLLYLNNVLPANWPHYWGFFYPETVGTARDVIEQTLGSFFNQEDVFGLRGEDGQDEVVTELNRERLKYVLREMEYKLLLFFWVQEAIHLGTGWTHTRICPHVRGDSFELLPKAHVISRFDQFPAEMGDRIDSMPYLFFREWLPVGQFRGRAAFYNWQHADEIEGTLIIDRDSGSGLVDNEDVWDDVYARFRAMGYGVTEGTGMSGRHGLRYVELLHYYEAGPNGYGCARHAVLADRKHLLTQNMVAKYGHNRKPVAEVKFAPMPAGGAQWQSVGLPALIRAYQDEINVRSAQEADAVEYFIKPQRLLGAAAGIKPATKLLPYPGQIIPADGDINAVRLLDMPPVPSALSYNRDRASIGIQRMSRITDISRGLGSTRGLAKGSETATGMGLLRDQTQRAATFQMLFFEEQGVVDQLTQIQALMQQAALNDVVVDVTDNVVLQKQGIQGYVAIPPEVTDGRWRVYLVGSTRAVQSPEAAATLLELLSFFGTRPGVAERLDWLKVFEAVGPMVTKRGVAEFLKSEEQMAAEAQQNMLMAVMQAQLQGGAGGPAPARPAARPAAARGLQ